MEIAVALHPHMHALRACYESAPRTERTLARAARTVTAEVSIEGRVAGVSFAPPGPVPVLAACARPLLDEVHLTPTNARSRRTFVFTGAELRALLAASR